MKLKLLLRHILFSNIGMRFSHCNQLFLVQSDQFTSLFLLFLGKVY